MPRAVSRREFVQAVAAAGGGLVVAALVPRAAAAADAPAAAFAPNAWIRITPDDRILFLLDRVEMGQGTTTSHAMLVAEELEVDPTRIEVTHAPADRAYDNPALGFQITGGSTSVNTSWLPLREAAAATREMLRTAAARTWNVPLEECAAENGRVLHRPTSRTATYGSLSGAAARVRVPRPKLKDPKDFRVIGQPILRHDARAKVDGSAVFGIDVSVPDLRVAVILRCPAIRGRLVSFEAAAAKAVDGVEHVLEVPTGVAVVARHYWQARKAAHALGVIWDESRNAVLSSDRIRARFAWLAKGRAKKADSAGDARQAIDGAARRLDAVYELPYLAHATMEPQNCTARVTPEGCEVWAPTQNPAGAREIAAQVAGVGLDRVTIHTTLLGGGFGRRIPQDFVAEAVHLAKAIGKPVKVVWSREDDLQHDFYRPASYHVLRAGLDAEGRVRGWHHRIVGQSIVSQMGPAFVSLMLPSWTPGGLKAAAGSAAGLYRKGKLIDQTSVEGAVRLPYDIADRLVEYVPDETGVPVGFWRSVGHSHNAFVVESFIDELAHAAGKDPYGFRRGLLARSPRHLAVLELAAQKAGWGTPAPAGVHRGIAQHHSFASYAAQVAEVSVADGEVRVGRVVCAIDCGRAVNPDLVRAQMESAVIFGLSAALKHRITFAGGRVEQSNFHDHELVRMHEAPAIEVHLLSSEATPTGVGEPGVPPVAPAVANAVFAATGRRVRSLPIALG